MTLWHLLARIGKVGIADLIGWRVGAYEGRPGRGRRLRSWVLISSAVLTVAALAGCDSGHTAGKSAAPATSTAASPTPPPAVRRQHLPAPGIPRCASRQPSRAAADRISTRPSPTATATTPLLDRTCGIPSPGFPRRYTRPARATGTSPRACPPGTRPSSPSQHRPGLLLATRTLRSASFFPVHSIYSSFSENMNPQ